MGGSLNRALIPLAARPRLDRRGIGPLRRWLYAVIGCVLGLGAPLGLLVVRSMQHGEPPWSMTAEDVRANWPVYLYVTVSAVVVLALFGATMGLLHDFERKVALEDPLTGLPNRRRFMLLLEHEFTRAERMPGDLSILILDVDGLKTINDRGGHAAGDRALRAVATVLRAVCRSSDLPARISGDEFAILVPGAGTEESAALGERVRAALAASPDAPHVSVGVATLSHLGNASVERLLAAADGALYVAKSTGRNCVVVAERERG